MINFIDIETTGLDPVNHEVIEVGIVQAKHRMVIDSIEFSLPFNEREADPKALEVNGWGKRKFAPQVSIESGLEFITEQFEDDAIFCAWHAHFDEGFLAQLFKKHGQKPPWNHRKVVDLPSLIMGRKGVITSGSSRELMKQLGLDPQFADRHTALADAEANKRCFDCLDLWEIEVG